MNLKHYNIIKKGVKYWNKWWNSLPQKGVVVWDIGQEAPIHETVDLSYADLSSMDLSGYIFENAGFEGAKFKNTNLMNTNLNFANCRFADFSGAIMRNTHINFTELNKAIFTGADLKGNEVFIVAASNETIDFNGALIEDAKISIINEEIVEESGKKILRAKSIENYKSGLLVNRITKK